MAAKVEVQSTIEIERFLLIKQTSVTRRLYRESEAREHEIVPVIRYRLSHLSGLVSSRGLVANL